MQSLIVAGPGRAGGSLLIAGRQAGLDVVGVLARRPDAIPSGFASLAWDEDLPAADLLIVAVRDGAIHEVAGLLAPRAGAVRLRRPPVGWYERRTRRNAAAARRVTR